jgi:hypothetical protein
MQETDAIEKWKDVEHWQRKLSNKYNSRLFAQMHGCQVPDLYWHGNKLHEIPFGKLPPQYVIRPSNGAGCKLVFLMNNNLNLFDGKFYSEEEIVRALEKALQNNPKLEFLFEEFMRNENGEYKIQDDFKVYTFNGEIACIQVINRLGPSAGLTLFYDKDWQVIKNVTYNYKPGVYQDPPKCLPEMLEQAIVLSKAYEIFVRIDFYATDKGAVFGEFTPTPAGGKNFTPFGNQLFVDYWDRYCKGKV